MNTDLNRLKLVLVEKKKTGKWLAEQLGKDTTTVSKWCTNTSQPSLETLVEIAKILEGKKVAKGIRVIVIPATQQIYLDAMTEGLIRTFIEAGAIVSTPTCGPCLGGYMGVLAEGERCISTTNRNFVGRMGHVESEVYLASPAVAAASAITGKISGPDEVMD